MKIGFATIKPRFRSGREDDLYERLTDGRPSAESLIDAPNRPEGNADRLIEHSLSAVALAADHGFGKKDPLQTQDIDAVRPVGLATSFGCSWPP